MELNYTLDGNYYLKNSLMVVCLISPHSDTNYKYMLRANSVKNHYRWTDCDFESLLETEKDIDRVLFDLNEYYEMLFRIN